MITSCEKRKNTEQESWENFNKTINEINKKQELFNEEIYSFNLEDYEIDLGYEEYYKIKNNKVFKCSLEYQNSKWEFDENCNYEINDKGFLYLTTNTNKYLIIDHNISDTIDSEYEHASYKLNDKRLKSIKSDGYFTETLNGKIIEYKIENLKKSVMNGFEIGDNPIYTNSLPFVTKRGNSGIGERIRLNCVNYQTSISILPGYVNTNREDLFYKNNRPKIIKIKDCDSNYVLKVELADIAIFQKIPLSHKMKNIEIEIVDIYKGTKYDDTCISGILIE